MPRPRDVETALRVVSVSAALFAALALLPATGAQDRPAATCVTATDAAELVLSPEQVGLGFEAAFVPSPGHIDPPAPGWAGLPVLRGFQNGPLRVSQAVSAFVDTESAAFYAADQAAAGHAAVRCGAFVVGIGATIERRLPDAPPQVIGAASLAWAVLGSVIGVPVGCTVTYGLDDGSPVAACASSGELAYDPDTGLWDELPAAFRRAQSVSA